MCAIASLFYCYLYFVYIQVVVLFVRNLLVYETSFDNSGYYTFIYSTQTRPMKNFFKSLNIY